MGFIHAERKELTYEDLLAALQAMSPEQRKQQVQIWRHNPDGDAVQALEPVIGWGTLQEWEEDRTRSSYDNQHHPEDFVIFTDWNCFAEDGSVATDLLTGERIFPDGKKDVQ